MNINIHYTFLPHTDADATLKFYCDTLGFELRNDVGYEDMRWLTVGPPNQPETSIVLSPPAASTRRNAGPSPHWLRMVNSSCRVTGS